MRFSWITLIVLSTAWTCGGCAAVIVGGATAAGTYVYMAGWLEQTYNRHIDIVWEAAQSAPASLGLVLQSKERTLGTSRLQFLDGNTDVWITLEATSPYTTKVAVRWGLLGDEAASRRILDAIGARL